MLLLADAGQAPTIGEWPPAAAALAAAFWPGGLTVVVPQRADVALPAVLTGGAATIGLRVPDHDAPRALAAAVGPLPTTSANRSGQPEASDAAAIVDQLGHAVAIVLDGGPAHGGPPSTVVDCTADPPRILRTGRDLARRGRRRPRPVASADARPDSPRPARRRPRGRLARHGKIAPDTAGRSAACARPGWTSGEPARRGPDGGIARWGSRTRSRTADASIADLDPELWAAMEGERRRQHDKIELIASRTTPRPRSWRPRAAG